MIIIDMNQRVLLVLVPFSVGGGDGRGGCGLRAKSAIIPWAKFIYDCRRS